MWTSVDVFSQRVSAPQTLPMCSLYHIAAMGSHGDAQKAPWVAYGHAQSDSDDRLTANPGRLAVEPLQQFLQSWMGSKKPSHQEICLAFCPRAAKKWCMPLMAEAKKRRLHDTSLRSECCCSARQPVWHCLGGCGMPVQTFLPPSLLLYPFQHILGPTDLSFRPSRGPVPCNGRVTDM